MLLRFSLTFPRRSKPLFIFPLLILLLSVPMISIRAAPGDLDPSFAGGGISQSPGTNFNYISTIAVQPDGKIIAGGKYTATNQNSSFFGQFALVRYLPNGLIDPSFGLNGQAITNFNEYQAFSIDLKDIAILPNGKIVAVGTGRVPVQGFPINTTDLFVVRYNSDGSLDTTFNNTGKFRSRVDFISSGEAIAVQSDGKFVVTGYGGDEFKGPPVPYKILLYRFSDSGLDPTFGNGGRVVTQFPNGSAYGYSTAIQPDGKIIVGGASGNSSIFGPSLTRFEPNGNLDLSFGNNGFVITSGVGYISDVAIQSDAKIVGVLKSEGTSNDVDFTVLRFDGNGSPDSSFGTNGRVVTAISSVIDNAAAVTLQPDGKIIAAGYTYNYNTASSNFPILIRYNSNGSLDTTFGNGGIVTTPAGYIFADIALQTDGKILVVSDSRVLRYLGDAPFNLRSTNFDFDGDGWADFAVTRKIDANLNWYAIENPSNSLLVNAEWGALADVLVPADFDGDAKTDVAVFRPSDGTWYILKSSDNSISAIKFGQNGDIPVPADFDGDGKADTAVFRSGMWFILNSSNNGFRAEQFGSAGDKPQITDFDGDHRADLTVYRNGIWYSQRSTAGFFAAQFGRADDITVPADYDGDGKTDLAVFRPSDGAWYLQNSFEGFNAIQFGLATDNPTPADFDGDGKTDITVYRSSVWYVRGANGDLRAINFGSSGDRPVPSAFQR